jgi:hypothetical protein
MLLSRYLVKTISISWNFSIQLFKIFECKPIIHFICICAGIFPIWIPIVHDFAYSILHFYIAKLFSYKISLVNKVFLYLLKLHHDDLYPCWRWLLQSLWQYLNLKIVLDQEEHNSLWIPLIVFEFFNPWKIR